MTLLVYCVILHPNQTIKHRFTMKNPFDGLKGRLISWRSKTSNIIFYTAFVSLWVVLLLTIFWGVRSCSWSGDYDFRNSDEAVACYRSFLNSLHETEKSDAERFCADINKWQEVRDTVAVFLAKDTLVKRDSPQVYSYYDITDSVKNEFARLSETWKCSFNDVIRIKEGTTPFRNDEEIIKLSQSASAFFIKLDNTKPVNVSKDVAIKQYRDFLIDIEHSGIRDTLELKKFLMKEDFYFRSFLAHLYELDGERISDITDMTERICNAIFIGAKKGLMDKKMVVTYMSMRTVRRLLQNSTVCVNDISHKKMRSEIQANAYLWMIIQPFMSIDEMAIVMITPEGRKNLKYIADQLSKSTSFARAFNIDQRSLNYLLPQQLLKMYVLTL